MPPGDRTRAAGVQLMQSRLSTHSPAGSVADDEELDEPDVCVVPELVPVSVLDPVVVVDVPVLVEVEPVGAVDDGVCAVVEPDAPVVPLPLSAPTAADVETVDCDCERAAVLAVGVGEPTESVRTEEPPVVDAESAVRRCLAIVVAGVPEVDRCASPAVVPLTESSEVGSSETPMARLSGAVAAWARVPDPWFIAETVRPPPTRATAVATTALRWFFFQRTRWRRRAARPSVTTGASDTSSEARPGSVAAAGSSWRPASCQVGASSQAVAAVPVVA